MALGGAPLAFGCLWAGAACDKKSASNHPSIFFQTFHMFKPSCRPPPQQISSISSSFLAGLISANIGFFKAD
jgi:hypothetical protein